MSQIATIRLMPDLCRDLIAALERLDWDASERGDVGTQEAWDSDGEAYAAAVADAVAAIDSEAGIIQGAGLADALETMEGLESTWGDDPATRQARRAIARALSWEVQGRDLLEMLRTGEE